MIRNFFYIRKHFLVITLLIFQIQIALIAMGSENKSPFTINVKVLKREKIHIETAALICALNYNNASSSQIEKVWSAKSDESIKNDDKYLVNSIIKDLCPEEIK